MRLAYARLIWRLDELNHVLHINWRALCDHNDRLVMGKS